MTIRMLSPVEYRLLHQASTDWGLGYDDVPWWIYITGRASIWVNRLFDLGYIKHYRNFDRATIDDRDYVTFDKYVYHITDEGVMAMLEYEYAFKEDVD